MVVAMTEGEEEDEEEEEEDEDEDEEEQAEPSLFVINFPLPAMPPNPEQVPSTASTVIRLRFPKFRNKPRAPQKPRDKTELPRPFLDASSHLYKSVCPYVRRSVGHAFVMRL